MVHVQDMFRPLLDAPLIGQYLQSELGLFVFVVSLFVVVAAVFHFVLKGVFHNLTRKTKTDVDDKIFDIIKLPMFVMIIVYGMFLALPIFASIEAYIEFIEGGFFVAYILVGALVANKITRLVITRMVANGDSKKTPNLLVKVVDVIVYLSALLVILSRFGVDITAGIAALGVGGIAIGLALQGTLRDFFSGLHIVTDKPINVGEYIEVQGTGVEGYVMDVGWRSTRIRTLPDNIVIIPNSKLADSIIVNNHAVNKEMGFVVDCGVAYGSDLDKVERVSLEVAKEIQKNTEGAVKSYKPLFRYKEFGDSNINFYVVLRVQQFVNKYGVRNEFIKALKKRFDEEGVEISWPVRKIFYGEGPGKK